MIIIQLIKAKNCPTVLAQCCPVRPSYNTYWDRLFTSGTQETHILPNPNWCTSGPMSEKPLKQNLNQSHQTFELFQLNLYLYFNNLNCFLTCPGFKTI